MPIRDKPSGSKSDPTTPQRGAAPDPYERRRSRPLARAVFRTSGQIAFLLKRLWHHPGLTVLALLGVVLAVGLVTSATFFSDAVEREILEQRLEDYSRITGRPPFSTNVYNFPSARRPLSLVEAEELADHVGSTLSSEIGLPLRHVGMSVSSGGMMLLPGEGTSQYSSDQAFLESINLVYIEGVEPYVKAVAGAPYQGSASGEILDVWMHARLADKMGVHVGEKFKVGVTVVDAPLTVHIKGFWQAKNPREDFWFSNPDETLKNSFLLSRQDYETFVEPLIVSKTRLSNWHVILDENNVTPANARDYLYGFERGLAIINKFLPDSKLNAPPLEPLADFVERETTLITLLLGFNVPAYGFLLYFLVLTSAIIARWQRRDTSTLVSRGMTTLGILGLTLMEELALFVVGIPLGIGSGMLLAQLMGHASSFLSFAPRAPLPVMLRGINIPVTILALAIALLARLWPAAQAARQSVVEEERERARPMRGPFWYRYYLDFLIFLPTYYAYRQLANEGTLAMLVQDKPEDLYRDPLLIVVPALFILTSALLTLRIFPLLMRLVDRLAGMMPWVTVYMALRSLSRQSTGYINPLLLMIVSLGLGVYTLSMAGSLDQWLSDRMYYRVGADVAFEPVPFGAGDADPPIDGTWIPPTEEFAELPGVAAASRVGDYEFVLSISGQDEFRGRFFAIDRANFPTVAWFRYDFAEESLGGLMNRLSMLPDGVLLPQTVMDEFHVNVGDKLPLLVAAGNELLANSVFTVVGSYHYFPTVYEEQDLTLIGNIDYVENLIGTPLPHYIWMRLEEGADGQAVLKSVPQTGVDVSPLRSFATQSLIADEEAKTERVGVFGTLSVAFLAAVAMAGIGLTIYSYASLQERLYRFAVLRAMGLGRPKIIAEVFLEYVFLTAFGAAAGALIGIFASELFVPFFRVTGEQGIPLPPLLPIIAQQDVRYLVAIFSGVMILMELFVIARALSWRHFAALRGRWE